MNKCTSQSDFPTPFAAFAEARRLASFIDDQNFIPAFASSSIKVLPYQIAAARFALRSKYLKGCILCDEGSLGKTYEALLVVAQKWYEGKENILIILPKNLIKQWQAKLEQEFTLPTILWKDYSAENKAIVLTSYDEAVNQSQELEKVNWGLAIFDEADFLFKPDNKSVIALKQAVGDAFKLLLTPTPITISIMDIYGLIHFIDEALLPDKDQFYKRYFRKPENYGELSDWVSQFAFRTLKNQVTQYVNFTNRIPIVINYGLDEKEKELYELTDKYLALPNKSAYPEMDNYQLTLQFYHTLSSSATAFANMLKAPIERASGEEQELLLEMKSLAQGILTNSKAKELIQTLKTIFSHLKQRKENQKTIIFANNLTTIDSLYNLLTENGYNILKHKDENAIEQFRADKNIQILITNDETAKGLDIEYCPVVINYDLLYNAVEMEQRICRCHRQGQQADVLVINMLSSENFSNVRILELINKRTLQFGKIFGMSDDIVGNFEATLSEVLDKRRATQAIKESFADNLSTHKIENEEIISNAENALFTTFTKDIADKISVSPKYIEEQAEQINLDLWSVVKYYFQTKHPEYFIDDEDKTITLNEDKEPPCLFYYWTGSRNKPYIAQRKYGLAKDFKPAHARITLTSIVVKGILQEIETFSEGEITVDGKIQPCEISFYNVELLKNNNFTQSHDLLVGKTESGEFLSDKQCREILILPVVDYKEEGKATPYWLSLSTGSANVSLDNTTEELIKNKYIEEKRSGFDSDIDLIKLKATREKNILEQSLNDIRSQVKILKNTSNNTNDRLEELKAQKQLNTLEKDLRKKEEGLFFEQMKIDAKAEENIDDVMQTSNISVRGYRLFKIKCIPHSHQSS